MHQIEQYYLDNYKRFVKAVYARCKNKDDAEDVVQEAFCRALQYWDEPKVLDAWFKVILENAYRDYQRDKRRCGCSDYDEVQEDMVYIDMSDWADDMYKKLQSEIEKIANDDHRQFIYLVLVKQYKPREALQTVPLTGVVARKSLQRFKEKFLETYGERS